jgi:hypothetical protein
LEELVSKRHDLRSNVHRSTPDYKKSLLQVYTEFNQHCVLTSGSLDILCRHWAPVNTALKAWVTQINKIGHGIDNYVDIETRLPSWIKRLDGSKYGAPDDILNDRKHGDVFTTLKAQYQATRGVPSEQIKHVFGELSNTGASGSTHPSGGINLLETYNGALTVRGIILGRVREVSTRTSEGMIPHKVFKMSGWKYSRRSSNEHTDYPVTRAPDRLWRSLVASQGMMDSEVCRQLATGGRVSTPCAARIRRVISRPLLISAPAKGCRRLSA